MSTVIISLFITMMLPIVCSWVAGYYRHAQCGEIDNKMPRLQVAKLVDAGHRASAAQLNSWEALGMYSAALLALFLAGVDLASVASWAMIFVGLRVLYVICYLANQDILRSISFIGGFGICIYFFCMAIGAAG